MKRKRLIVSSVFLKTLLFVLTGTLKNGEHCADAASFVPRLHHRRQIDQMADELISSLKYMLPHQFAKNKDGGRIYAPAADLDFSEEKKRVPGAYESRPNIVILGDDETSGIMPSALLKRHARSAELDFRNQRHYTDADYGVVVSVGETVKNHSSTIDEAMRDLKQAFYNALDWDPTEYIIDVRKINFAGDKVSSVELCFRQIIGYRKVRIPASEILKYSGLLEKLKAEIPELRIQSIFPENETVQLAVYDAPFYMETFFPYVIAGASMLTVFVLGLVTYACFCRSKASVDLANAADGLGSQHLYHQQQQQQPGQQHVLYPDIAPDTASPLAIQPCAPSVFVPVGYATTPVPAQPIRIKRKGLLERRGSNASLTLDLQPSPEMGRWDGTPPKESTGLEYLMSAGNRLSRRDLRNAAKNTKVLYEEFWEIPMNHPEKVSVAGSGMKNRYKTIIPNEHSRVVLPDADQDPLSSYINANYIRGYEGEAHAYVATQGPMAHTIVDFWQMVWHESCPIIVMITKLKEKSKPKCENYLPEHHGVYGDIEVTIAKIIQKKGYVVRHLQLKFGGETRMLLHFWYTTWPDHKPPDSPSMLLELVKEVELRRFRMDGITPRGPVIVHCSAGIGRTGCFVGISIGIRQLREEHSVDILGIVCGMRLDRGGMIQTHEQYDFVHQALLEYERTLGEPSIQSLTALTSEGP